MLWSPAGPTVPVGDTSTLFVPTGSGNLGGVARLVNILTDTVVTFTLGGPTVTNTHLIPLTPGQDIVVAYGAGDTHAIASVAGAVHITPGIARP